MSSERLTTIRAAAERVAQSYDLEIFDVQLRRESIGTVLRVTIDRPDRGVPERPEDAVGITECQRVSQDLSAILDVEEEQLGEAALGQHYTLEVSSPGLDRVLRHAADYRRFAGRLAKDRHVNAARRAVRVSPDASSRSNESKVGTPRGTPKRTSWSSKRAARRTGCRWPASSVGVWRWSFEAKLRALSCQLAVMALES